MRAGLVARVRKRCAVVALTIAALTPMLAACSNPGSAATSDVAWVTTGASVTDPGIAVTPVDLDNHHAEDHVPLGSLPSALAYTAGDAGLLVVTRGDDTLHEIDPATHDVMHNVSVGVEPNAVAVAPGGTGGKGIALVANFDSNNVTPVDLGTWRAGTPIPVGQQPVAIAVASPGGRSNANGNAIAFVADFGSNQVTPILLPTLRAASPIAVGPSPQAIATTAGQLLVGNFGNHTLTGISIMSARPPYTVALPFNPTGIAVPTSDRPDPAGTRVYVCGGAGAVPVRVGGLASLLGRPLTVGTQIALPNVAQGIALNRDDTTAWVTQQAGSIVPVNLRTRAVGHAVHLGGHPSAIVIGPG